MISRAWHGTAFAAAILLSACAGENVQRPPPEGLMSVTARLAAPPVDAVDVVIANVPPGRQIEQVTVIDSKGDRHPAASLVPVSVAEGSTTARPVFALSARGGSSSGFRPSLGVGWNITRSGSDRTSLRVAARVPIPDPAAYRTTSNSWRVEVGFTEIDGEMRRLTFPARAP